MHVNSPWTGSASLTIVGAGFGSLDYSSDTRLGGSASEVTVWTAATSLRTKSIAVVGESIDAVALPEIVLAVIVESVLANEMAAPPALAAWVELLENVLCEIVVVPPTTRKPPPAAESPVVSLSLILASVIVNVPID